MLKNVNSLLNLLKLMISSIRITNLYSGITYLNDYSVPLRGYPAGISKLTSLKQKYWLNLSPYLQSVSPFRFLHSLLMVPEWSHHKYKWQNNWVHKSIEHFQVSLRVPQLCISMSKEKKEIWWLYFSCVPQIWLFPKNTDHLLHYHPLSPETQRETSNLFLTLHRWPSHGSLPHAS